MRNAWWLIVLAGCSSSENGSEPIADAELEAATDDVLAPVDGSEETTSDAAGDTKTEAPKFLPTFPVGVDAQPQYSWDKWKMRGIDTLCRAELQGKTVEWIDSEAKKAGLRLIRQPLAKPADDIGNAALLAWSHGDEPDLHVDTTPPTTLKASYDAWKAVDPARLVFVNVSGWNLMNMPSSSKCDAACYTKLTEAADWIGNDYYPVNIDQDVEWVGKAVDKLRTLSKGKAQLAYIEASDQELPWASGAKGPTPEQLHAEIWNAIVHGARGICYFPQRIGGAFSYDNTVPAVVDEMTKQNALLHELGASLQGEIDPAPVSVKVASPLEAGWRVDAGKTYVIVVNLKNTTTKATVTITGSSATTAKVHGESRSVTHAAGAFEDSFAGYAVHIYEL
jgi:hypothetical protein